jgi:4-aminobutyrate aminotransferase-like enzyme
MELALRLARAHRPGKDVIVLDDTDYGMTTSLANMSPGQRKFWVQAARRGDAPDVERKTRVIEHSGRGLCGFFAEGVFEPGYLRAAYQAVRAAGGLNVAIEAQTGMGRVGPSFWEFARHGVTPDIVVIGDSMGNGFPMAAVVTRPDLAAPFDTGTGGGPVACAAGLAVLDVLEPPTWSPDFHGFQARGAGLCWEIDLPDAPSTAARLRDCGILIGVRSNTLLFRPPLTFSPENAVRFVTALRGG